MGWADASVGEVFDMKAGGPEFGSSFDQWLSHYW